MASSEAFTFVETTHDLTKQGYNDYVEILSAKIADVDVQLAARLRADHPEYIVTTVPADNVDLLLFANLGYAHCELDLQGDSICRWRGYVPPDLKGRPSFLGEIINYARYKYQFGEEFFILYYAKFGYTTMQYLLKEPRGDHETPLTHSSSTDKLVKAAGDVLYKQSPGIYVFDGYWSISHHMYQEVEKATWDKVILDPGMKQDLTEVSEKFFDSKDIYDDLGVPWKRGIMFYG
jgi:transitional endoplasmic reticulum ATPase